jgi:hypothetical protein
MAATRHPRRGCSCRPRAASTHLRAHLAHGADGEVVRLLLAQRVAAAHASDRIEPELDARKLLQQRPVVLAGLRSRSFSNKSPSKSIFTVVAMRRA